MTRINPVRIDRASAEAASFLGGIQQKFGRIPNFFATAAHAPAIASAFAAFNGALTKTRLTAVQREAIALSQAGYHGCPYCSAAHAAFAKHAGIAAEEIGRNLKGQSEDKANQAVIDFARAVLSARGAVDDAALKNFKAAGFDDGHVIEVIAAIAANIFTNFTNLVARPDIDFPSVEITN